MKRLIAALALIGLVGGYLVAPAEAQGRFWVLVNGALRYTGRVQINGGPVLFPDGTSGAPSIAFASEPTLGLWRSAAGTITAQATSFNSSGSISATNTVSAGATQDLRIATRLKMYAPADGNLSLNNNALTIGSQFKVDALPTIASGFGTSPSIVAGSTPLAGSILVGTGGTATSGVMNFNGTAFPSAPFCLVASSLTNVPTRVTALTTTQLTVTTSTAWTSGDVLMYHCISSK